MFVVVINEFAEDHFELPAMEHKHPVKALPSNSSDEALGEPVRPRGSNGRADDPDAIGSEHFVEARGELGIAVPDQEVGRATLFSQDQAQIASLLSDPLSHRIGGDAAHMHAPGAELDEEEHIETAKQHRVDVEEVLVCPCAPRLRLFGCQIETVLVWSARSHVRAPDRPGRTEPAHRSSPPADLQVATHNDAPHVRLFG